MRGTVIKGSPQAIKDANALIVSPYQPKCAVKPTSEAINIEPTPTGLMSYKCERLNSICLGLIPSGLLITKSATTELNQANTMTE